MTDFKDYFKGKKVTVMRIGLLGRGIGDAAYMAEAGAIVTVVDSASAEVMQSSVDALQEYKNITFKFGPYDFADFKDADFVLVGAGAPLDEPVLIECSKNGVPLKQSAALFAELSKIPIIGVTGTRGKSTVTHMIHHVLETATGEPVLLGGNVRGVSNLQLLNEVREDSLAVMELDSWQLQGFGWAKISPQVGVFTNLMPDHLNYYKQDMDLYFRDKANIFLYQEEGATLVTVPELLPRIEACAKKEGVELQQDIVLADSSILPEDCILSLPGEHNRLNAALAYKALEAAGLTAEEIFEGLASFPALPGRLQYLGTHNDIKIYNDNNATTPAATIAALRTLGESAQQNVVLIMGGADKDIDMEELLAEIPKYCKQVVLLPGTGTDRIADRVHGVRAGTMEEAVAHAFTAAKKGDTIVLSPAFASFGLFRNEYERGDQFVTIVKKTMI